LYDILALFPLIFSFFDFYSNPNTYYIYLIEFLILLKFPSFLSAVARIKNSLLLKKGMKNWIDLFHLLVTILTLVHTVALLYFGIA